MKTRIVLGLMFVLGAFKVQAQDPATSGISPIKSPIQVNETTVIETDIFNGSSAPIPLANKVTWTINLPPNIEVISLTFDTPGILSFLTVTIGAYDVDEGTVIMIVSDKGPFPGGTGTTGAYQVFLTVKGVKETGPTPAPMNINAVTMPAVGTNVFGNDNADSEILVQGTKVILPVKLLSFDAIKESNVTQLKWSTTEETNSDYFEIQRSQNGKSWMSIGSEKSTGESNALKNYSFTDKAPLNGENLYRLKMIDKDLTFAYSRIAAVTFEGLVNKSGNELLSVYPNPASDMIFLKSFDSKNIENVAIVDMTGRTVYRSKSIGNEGINISNLSSGLYILNVTGLDGFVHNRKIIVRK
jgi:hypothetical protein